MLDFAHHDHVVDFDVTAAVIAFEPGRARRVEPERAAGGQYGIHSVEMLGHFPLREAASQRNNTLIT